MLILSDKHFAKYLVKFLNQAHAWFLDIGLVREMCVCVCVSVCVSTPEASNNQWRDMARYGPHMHMIG